MANSNNLGLNGINPLSYMGINSATAPNLIVKPRAPTDTDYKNMQIGTLWLNSEPESPTKADIYMLTSVADGIAVWASFA